MSKMRKEILFTEGAPAPVGPYSQANKVGNLLFVSGQLGLRAGEKTLEPTLEEQTKLALENLMSVLKAAGLGPEHVVKTTCFLADIADFPAFNEVYGTVFAENPP
ncbi:MAG: RidA family protein, partial [Alkalispirochaetaceae bacterium]